MKVTVENVMTMSVKTDPSLVSNNRYRLITLHNHSIIGEGRRKVMALNASKLRWMRPTGIGRFLEVMGEREVINGAS